MVKNPISISGSFAAWQPSTWPVAPSKWNVSLIGTLREIFEKSILNEIDSVIADAGGNLEGCGHVVAIALLCALDGISSYGYGARSGKQVPEFVREHFPLEYRSHATPLLKLYRHAMVHSWNLFEAGLLTGDEPVGVNNGVIYFGLRNFRDAISEAMNDYLKDLVSDKKLQAKTLQRYKQLKASAKG